MVRTSPPAPPARSLAPTENTGTAHIRRVTLNLIRHAACCPDDLRVVLNKLADRALWDMAALTQIEREFIFATVDDDLADRAKDEFDADLETLVDHRHNEAHCVLCGHNPIRWEFTLRNKAGGHDVNTGSTCIETYGINVDGSATSAHALALLREAIRKAKRKAEREDWQAAHEDHEGDADRLRALLATLQQHRKPGWLYRHLKSNWNGRVNKAINQIRGAVRYYEREGFMTPLQTERVYSDGFLGKRGDDMIAELNEAIRRFRAIRAAYDAFIANHGDVMTREERRLINYLRMRGFGGTDLTREQKRAMQQIRDRYAAIKNRR